MSKTQIFEHLEVSQLIEKLGQDLALHLQQKKLANPLLLGIHTGGVWIAEQLHQQLDIQSPLGSLDISFYRDDFTRIGMHPVVKPSNIPGGVEDRHIILVDDVLQSGRTVRAALNEIFDYGRPASITLVVLVERDGRELPIEPTLSAMQVTGLQNPVTLTGPSPLNLIIGRDKQEARKQGI